MNQQARTLPTVGTLTDLAFLHQPTFVGKGWQQALSSLGGGNVSLSSLSSIAVPPSQKGRDSCPERITSMGSDCFNYNSVK